MYIANLYKLLFINLANEYIGKYIKLHFILFVRSYDNDINCRLIYPKGNGIVPYRMLILGISIK